MDIYNLFFGGITNFVIIIISTGLYPTFLITKMYWYRRFYSMFILFFFYAISLEIETFSIRCNHFAKCLVNTAMKWYPCLQIVNYDKYNISGSRNKILRCFHPRGIFPVCFCYENCRIDNFVFCVDEIFDYIPVFNLFKKMLLLKNCSPTEIHKLMCKDKNICIVVGGNPEMHLCSINRHKVYIKKKKGFIKYALRYGYKLQPVYCFGEADTFHIAKMFQGFGYAMSISSNYFLNRFSIMTIFFSWGKFYLLPRRTPLMIAYGSIIKLPHIHEPTDDEINYWHSVYIEKLKILFENNIDEWKRMNPCTATTLEIV